MALEPITLPGTGETVACDDAGADGAVQIIKLAISTDGSATLIPADASNGIDVDVTRVIPGTSATHLGKAEDSGHTSADTGVLVLAVRRDTAAVGSDTDGDYSTLNVDSTGRLRTNVTDTRVGALSNARTTALDDILLVKNAGGTLFGFQGYTDDDGYVVVIADADGTISGGAQCLEAVHVVDPTGGTAGGTFSFDGGRYGIAISTGICIAFSSTGPTFTNGGNHMFVSAQYE